MIDGLHFYNFVEWKVGAFTKLYSPLISDSSKRRKTNIQCDLKYMIYYGFIDVLKVQCSIRNDNFSLIESLWLNDAPAHFEYLKLIFISYG